MLRYLLLAIALPALLGAQAIVQYAVAAAAGTAAGSMIGKQVSNSLDKVVAATTGAEAASNPKGYTKQMEGPYKAKGVRAKKTVVPNLAAKAVVPPAAIHRAARVSKVGPFGIPYPEFPAPPVVEHESAAIPPLPTYESMRSLTAGAAGSDVVARLGSPAARVTMPGEEGGLVEIYYYQSGGSSLGAVRLQDGSVSAVIVNNE